MRAIGSGWRLSVIYRRSSGRPLNLTTGVDNSLTGKSNQRALQVLGNPYGDKSGRPGTNFLNPAAFVIPARSEEHTSELQSRPHLVCRLLLEKKTDIRDTQIYCPAS